MHEISIAVDLVEGVLREAEKRGRLKIEAVHLRLGKLAGVDKDALLFTYGLACEGTSLAGSHLKIEDVPAEATCSACGASRIVEDLSDLRCPECRTPEQEIVRGREIEIAALEVES